jgi:hypothetical protein
MKQYIKSLLVFVLFSVLINVVLFTLFYKPKRVATLDLQGIINDYIKSIANRESNEREMEQFILQINDMIKDVSKENNLIIVPKQVIFYGVDIDITNEFRRLLNVK